MAKAKEDTAPLEVLSLEAIVQIDDVEYKDVPCPEWGGKVVIRSMSKAEQNQVRSLANTNQEDVGVFEQALFTTAMFNPTVNEAQYTLLSQKKNVVLERILKAIIELNGMGDAADEKKDAEFQK